jgi:hypothetical protein
MTFIIDLIGATIAGVLVVITIIKSIFNVQMVNFNIQMLLSLNTHSQQVSEVLSLNFLEAVGKYVPANVPTSVHLAEAGRFHYYARESFLDWDNEHNQVFTIEVAPDGTGGNVLIVRQGEGAYTALNLPALPVVYDTLPIYLVSPEVFTYFDEDNVLIPTPVPAGRLADVRSIRVDLVFTTPAWSHDDGFIEVPITFWRHFKNLYIDEPT